MLHVRVIYEIYGPILTLHCIAIVQIFALNYAYCIAIVQIFALIMHILVATSGTL